MLWTAFTVAYAAIATFSIYMTWREHILKKRGSIVFAMFGMLACIVWPLVLAVISIAQRRQSTL